ncbi:MAG TPA: hypothetical protein VF461_01780 [Gemmatimonadaceae bacterium]
MIAALKQYGTNYARRTIRRQLINYGIGGVLVITGAGYYFVTGKPYPGAEAKEPEPAPVVHHPRVAKPKPEPATPAPAAAAPATSTPGAPITAQGIDINAPKRAAQKAVAAENAQLAAQTGQEVPAAQPAPISGPGSVPSGALPAPALQVARSLDGNPAANSVTREVYRYGGIGRRDPFYSLILTDDLRPLLQDLKLVGILYEPSGRRTVAVMRDLQTNAQYRVLNGQQLGRMRVTQIRQRAVLFTIEEFGLSRMDSLVWTDTLKVRN